MNWKSGKWTLYTAAMSCLMMWGAHSRCAVYSPNDSLDSISTVLLYELDEAPKRVLERARIGLSSAQNHQYELGKGRFHMRMAQAYYRLSTYDSSLHHFHRALSIRKNMQDWYRASNTCKEINYVYQDLGMRDSAFQYLITAAQLRDRLNDEALTAEIMIELAQLSNEYEAFDDAKQYLERAENALVSSRDSVLRFLFLNTSGIYFLNTESSDSALQCFDSAAKYLPYFDNPAMDARHLNYLAATQQLAGNEAKALDLYQRAREAFQSEGMEHDLCLVRFNMGQLFLETDALEQGLSEMKAALDCSMTLGDLSNAKRSLEALIVASKSMNDLKAALDYEELLRTVSDSMLNAEKIRHINRLQVQYQTELKEREIALLSERNKKQEAQRNALIAGVIAVTLIALILLLVYQQKRRTARKNQEIANEKIQSLLSQQESKVYNAMMEGQEEERKRIATDLHDRLGSMLSTVKLMFSDLHEKIDHQHQQHESRLEKISDALDEAVSEVRKISHNLSASMLSEFGLSRAVEDLCSSIDAHSTLRCEFQLHGIDRRLSSPIEIGIYRIVQEAFSNIIKHANASEVVVQINHGKNEVTVTIEDNGVGFDLGRSSSRAGIGLQNMKERAAAIDAKLHLDSSVGRGTMVIIEIPVP